MTDGVRLPRLVPVNSAKSEEAARNSVIARNPLRPERAGGRADELVKSNGGMWISESACHVRRGDRIGTPNVRIGASSYARFLVFSARTRLIGKGSNGSIAAFQRATITASRRLSKPLIFSPKSMLRISCRPCENSGTFQSTPEFRGLRSRRAEKITKNRSPRDHTEPRIEFSHGLLEFCYTADARRLKAPGQ